MKESEFAVRAAGSVIEKGIEGALAPLMEARREYRQAVFRARFQGAPTPPTPPWYIRVFNY